ncbi:CRTAC1 family protein [Fimbriiglobus ruber]|uniref:ASPIC/UnbV domain protein n=1 Tax=Fimbriiglobus ruber TaxID=1908690 RepID=A0A225D889_9BACT|nr:CRTAC1 family protein [Fimbriiglobus ruber]OWK37771.1 ASPIC/UnbV domain protein [Fimbriiglobus ruber]
MRKTLSHPATWLIAAGVSLLAVGAGLYLGAGTTPPPTDVVSPPPPPQHEPRKSFDTSGFLTVADKLKPWPPTASLEEVADSYRKAGYRLLGVLDQEMAKPSLSSRQRTQGRLVRAVLLNYEGEPAKAYQALSEARAEIEADAGGAREWLFTFIFYQGVTALRRGETDNCVLCRGESSCILPIAAAAVHTQPTGSRLAIQHFTEYLDRFPDDLEVRWLLNITHMTLGEHPAKVDPRYLVSLDRYTHSEFDIGRFRDVGHLVGVNRLNQAGGVIMDDFDGDDLPDIVVSSFDPTEAMVFYRNKGDGTFEDRTKEAGLSNQIGGGLYCVQGDYNNDGHPDVYVCRGAWLLYPVRPSLLRNDGNGTFTDVTAEAGLLDPVNSISASWADYDNDGHLDLFVCNETGPCRLYRNRGNGTFEEVAGKAGVSGGPAGGWKGVAWVDYDNDGYPDLFVNNMTTTAALFRNNRDGTFSNVTAKMGIDGPRQGFSCWAWDFDNDGYLDIFASCYDRALGDVVKGLTGQPHSRRYSNKLYRNLGGKKFQDVTKEAGLDVVMSPMGSNFGDFDNDGYLDFYMGTGDPSLFLLVPNRMFKNVGGKRFAEITGTSGTGHLQKGHAVACGDWDRNGTVDVFIEMGGAVNGDKYHNILFQNPGQGNNWLSVKLVGKKSNRSAIGARIKVQTAGPQPLTVHRHVSSGSSFGANPLEQHVGLGKADRVAVLEVYWPTSGTTQVFRDVPVNRGIEVTEFATDYRTLDRKPIPLPKGGEQAIGR